MLLQRIGVCTVNRCVLSVRIYRFAAPRENKKIRVTPGVRAAPPAFGAAHFRSRGTVDDGDSVRVMGPWYGAVDLCHNSAGRRPGRRAREIKNGAQHVCALETLVVRISYTLLSLLLLFVLPLRFILFIHGPWAPPFARQKPFPVATAAASALSIDRPFLRVHARATVDASPPPIPGH